MFEVNENYTRVSEFVIVGFPGLHPSFYQLVAWFFFFIYVTTVVGNILLVVLFALERSLQKPMYIIMLSLALSDIGFATVALPKVIARWWWDDGRISFHTCLFQEQMIHYFGTLNSLIMLTMAMDRYLAICHPLSITLILMTALLGLYLAFCGPNRILHAYCDALSLTKLSCSDMAAIQSSSIGLAYFVLLVPFSFIVFSYTNIIVTVILPSLTQGRLKTFSTCATQGCIILIYYIPRFVVYSSSSKVPILFYSLFPPVANPFIYSFRTKEIRAILGRWRQDIQIASS
uniref:G-protein coupled receptors family 1 profile domain-containing protein n=1 Tax=Hucho hucho TaxID=62062 RepID=A0A4W5K0X5_9TELE